MISVPTHSSQPQQQRNWFTVFVRFTKEAASAKKHSHPCLVFVRQSAPTAAETPLVNCRIIPAVTSAHSPPQLLLLKVELGAFFIRIASTSDSPLTVAGRRSKLATCLSRSVAEGCCSLFVCKFVSELLFLLFLIGLQRFSSGRVFAC